MQCSHRNIVKSYYDSAGHPRQRTARCEAEAALVDAAGIGFCEDHRDDAEPGEVEVDLRDILRGLR